VPVLEIALKRQAYGVKPIDDSVIADQQKIADTFFGLGLLPKAINVKDVV
jgi:sulfonate transport system substrate-binding protein